MAAIIQSLKMERGEMPSVPDAASVAVEAGVPLDRAQAVIAASWELVEAFTGRVFWPVLSAQLHVHIDGDAPVRWPRFPWPEDVTVTDIDRSMVPMDPENFSYSVSGWVSGLFWQNVVIQPTAPIVPPAPKANVVEAVRNLALYQLIHSATRREFKSLTAGDSTLVREAAGPLMGASGAGALLRGEVIW